MRDTTRWLAAVGIAIAAAIGPIGLGASERTARADTSSNAEADTLFAQGRELLEKGNYADACAKLQRSEELAPAVGTLLNLGYCWEQLGKMRSAMEAYSEAQIMARTAGDAKRYNFAKERFEAVSPRAVKLVVRVADPKIEGLEVRRNGTVLPKTDWDQPIPIDPAEFTIIASAPNRASWTGTVTARGEGQVATITVPALPPAKAGSEHGGASAELTSTRWAALGLGAVAAASLGAGIAVGFSAKSRYDDANYHCDDAGCDEIGATIQHDARSQGNLATGLIGLGAISAAAGIYLWIVGGPEAKTGTKASGSSAHEAKAGTGPADGERKNVSAATMPTGLRVGFRPLGVSIGASF